MVSYLSLREAHHLPVTNTETRKGTHGSFMVITQHHCDTGRQIEYFLSEMHTQILKAIFKIQSIGCFRTTKDFINKVQLPNSVDKSVMTQIIWS